MQDIMYQMYEWILVYYGDGLILIMAIVSFIYLFVHDKNIRNSIIFPSLFIVFLLLNPFLYQYFFGSRYWRYFWTIPSALIISLFVIRLIEKSKNRIYKISVFAAAVLLTSVLGTNVYLKGSFVKIENPYKISQSTCEVCNAILEIDKAPKCILATETLYTEARQYSGDIRLLYGRDVEGYIIGTTEEIKNIHLMMESEKPDYNYILSMASSEECDIIVNVEEKPIDDKLASEYGYKFMKSTNGYNIYYNSGI
ncbi:MAG: hypothetical protein J5517_00660 [Eubacterium sp.]|nr:hypothetical protein [Eubacterium sp.]